MFPVIKLILITLPCMQTVPVRGRHQWTVFLCKFKPSSLSDKENFESLPTADVIHNWLNDRETDGAINNYFHIVSNGLYDVGGTRVFGWFTLPLTKSQVLELKDDDGDNTPDQHRTEERQHRRIKRTCIEQARNSFNLDRRTVNKNIITVIQDSISLNTALYCKFYGVLLSHRLLVSVALEHEMVHSLGIGHSSSDRPVIIFEHQRRLGEYDDQYDLMSASHVYSYWAEGTSVLNGPGLSGPHLDYLGWLPMQRIYWFGRNQEDRSNTSLILRLASLSEAHRQTRGPLLLCLPYDPDDHNKYYSIELRTKTRLDRGFPRTSSILIHKIEKEGENYYATLLSQGPVNYHMSVNDTWNSDLYTVSVLAFDDRLNHGR